MKPHLSLKSLRGQVHRFTGVVDRVSRFSTAEGWQETMCIRDLHLADSNRPIQPDHWWFKLRECWLAAGVQSGDRVLFTAKVQYCTKGLDGPEVQNSDNPRRKVIGFGSKPRSVVILQRATPSMPIELELQTQLAIVVHEYEQLQQVQQQLVTQNGTLAQKLSQTRTEVEQGQQELRHQEQVCTQLRFALRRAQHWSRPVVTAGTALVIGLGSGLGLARLAPNATQAQQPQSADQVCTLEERNRRSQVSSQEWLAWQRR
ncbi:hypothetical protein VZG28_04370 [Synechococcus elongatus IITB4]|uniref:hypothetical protein n=1 Tax=Synechococcus elongatus TaxID=32046 RepID=UPI0030D5775A